MRKIQYAAPPFRTNTRKIRFTAPPLHANTHKIRFAAPSLSYKYARNSPKRLSYRYFGAKYFTLGTTTHVQKEKKRNIDFIERKTALKSLKRRNIPDKEGEIESKATRIAATGAKREYTVAKSALLPFQTAKRTDAVTEAHGIPHIVCFQHLSRGIQSERVKILLKSY